MSFKTFFSGSVLVMLTAGLTDFACTVGDDGGSHAAGAGGTSTTTTATGSGTRATTSTTGTGGNGGSGGSGGTGDSTSGAGGSDGSGGTTAGEGGAGGSGGTGGVKTDGGGGTAGTRLDAGGGGSSGSGGTGTDCASKAGLVWKTANKTNFESYPAPNSEECIKYNGCAYLGQFSACGDKKEPLTWVMTHNIVSFFPNFNTYKLHDLCLKSSTGKTIVVTVLDTCGDSDCGGCCTENKGTADALVDLEKYTNDRWGVADGRIMWADLGPTKGSGCN